MNGKYYYFRRAFRGVEKAISRYIKNLEKCLKESRDRYIIVNYRKTFKTRENNILSYRDDVIYYNISFSEQLDTFRKIQNINHARIIFHTYCCLVGQKRVGFGCSW